MIWLLALPVVVLLWLVAYVLGYRRGRDEVLAVFAEDPYVAHQREAAPWQ